MNSLIHEKSVEEPADTLWQEFIPGGGHWSGIVRRGTTLRLIDVAGCANAATLFFNAAEKSERYNMADTLKAQHTFHLTSGHACHSDMGRIFCCITQDTVGWHDCVCGLSDRHLIERQYGITRYQECRNDMYRNGLDNLLIELGKWGLGWRDIVPNVNFFSKVTVDEQGTLTFHVHHAKPGAFVDLAFVMDTLVAISAAPHPLDPARHYQPGPVQLIAHVTPHTPEALCGQIAENVRALRNTERFYAACSGERK